MKLPEVVTRKIGFSIIGVYAVLIIGSLLLLQRYYFTPKDYYRMRVVEQKQALSNKENDHKAMAELGKSYYDLSVERKSDYYLKLARNEFEQALELSPGEITYEYMLGLIYKDLGEERDSIDMFRTILRKDPLNVYANYELGIMSSSKKEYDQAIEYFKNAMKIESTSATLLYQLGLAYENKGDPITARQCYELAVKYIPDYEDAIVGLARVSKTENRGQSNGN